MHTYIWSLLPFVRKFFNCSCRDLISGRTLQRSLCISWNIHQITSTVLWGHQFWGWSESPSRYLVLSEGACSGIRAERHLKHRQYPIRWGQPSRFKTAWRSVCLPHVECKRGESAAPTPRNYKRQSLREAFREGTPDLTIGALVKRRRWIIYSIIYSILRRSTPLFRGERIYGLTTTDLGRHDLPIFGT